jgi:hypothetical protein
MRTGSAGQVFRSCPAASIVETSDNRPATNRNTNMFRIGYPISANNCKMKPMQIRVCQMRNLMAVQASGVNLLVENVLGNLA